MEQKFEEAFLLAAKYGLDKEVSRGTIAHIQIYRRLVVCEELMTS